nr:AAA family ATPase [Saccharibacillus endophyticus]
MKLKDFRQFKGEQFITFADDPVQNVTVIMGDNGAGKTTLAQAFTWCLYGETSFKDKVLLCRSTSSQMLPGQLEKVRAELTLIHKNTEYTIISEQNYKKTDKIDKPVESVGQREATIIFKKDGQQEYVKTSQRDGRLKEILPEELARYFFFDGENIKDMGDDLSQGKGTEFARAVRSLLGLDAFTAAIDHLNKTIKSYKPNSGANLMIEQYNQQIEDLDKEIDKIEKRLEDIRKQEVPMDAKIIELQTLIEKNKASEQLAANRKKLLTRHEALEASKSRNIGELLSVFKQAPAYFSKKMMKDSLHLVQDAGKLDKSVPFVRAETIKYLLERNRCICGTELSIGSDTYAELNSLFNYVPPKSIGDSINDFRKKCRDRVRSCETMLESMEAKYADICSFDSEYEDVEQELIEIDKQLSSLDDVGKVQADLMRYKTELRNLDKEKDELNVKKGIKESEKQRKEKELSTLALQDKQNRQIMLYKAYAQYMYDSLRMKYEEEEAKVREKLEKTVNEIFHDILGEGFSLKLNSKYDVEVVLNEIGGSSETSTAQNISIIFAFIAGVIQMARDSQNDDVGLLVSEPYPLVMDAPLSAFDKTRIQTVCDVLPKIAEQVIIFIKDADGEIAEEHLGNRIGRRLSFNAVNKVETYVTS